MSSISQSLAAAVPALPHTSVQTILVIVALGIAGGAYYASPPRLTRVMVAAIAAAEQAYVEALQTGALSPTDVHADIAEKMFNLQTKVSTIRGTTLRNSLSGGAALRQYLTGHTFTLVRCIWEVRGLETHIEILKEARLRDTYASEFSTAIRAVLRRRCKLFLS
ncbi:hypothetical protein GGX14DRAFT_648466 [Mycena pura]|uniref:Uncharacterized protein n=1 Tax=Mycena pura TaxID=153505 RepID=A0AAD6YMM4_9AGAR|nr:hypothetical protein GGX14DRAFT_648466 [Mycena pura]